VPASLRARLALTFALVVAISLIVAAASLFALLRGYSARLVQARLDDVVLVVWIQARALNQRGESPFRCCISWLNRPSASRFGSS
jgi:hypothetical protein